MKRAITLTIILSIVFSFAMAEIEKYYIGAIEISRDEYFAVDKTFIRSEERCERNDTAKFIIELSVYARIDTVEEPGKIKVVQRSAQEIRRIKEYLDMMRTKTAKYEVGDTLSGYKLPTYANTEGLTEIINGKVTLLNFWATWCGPCVQELKPEGLPYVISQFKNHDNFCFIPISVNHNKQELDDFFASERGKGFEWLAKTTLWDKNGVFADKLSAGGIPLTILLNENGVVVLNEAGAFLSEEQLARLRDKIAELLR